jgi:putative membrane protein
MSEQLILRDKLAQDRTHLANERTLLAYWRTALAFIGVGLVVIKFFPKFYYIILAFISIIIGSILFI